MGVAIEIALPGQTSVDALALTVARPTDALGGDGARIVDEKLRGRLGELARTGELRGDRGEALLLHHEGELSAPRVVAAEIGRASCRERV